MQCPSCTYELWNLTPGPCPECGRVFRPSEFAFLPNAVRFCCPYCDQAYYGTNDQGHTVPSSFSCARCGRWITLDEMVLRPAEALGSRSPLAGENPWLGPWRSARWFATVVAGLTRPGDLLEATPSVGGMGRAWAYLLINLAVGGGLGLAMALILMITSRSGTGFMTMATICFFVPLGFVLLWTGITHGLLGLLRVEKNEGLGRTFQALAYTSGAWIAALLTCPGAAVGLPLWAATACIAVARAHRCSMLKATCATLAAPTLLVLGLGGAWIWMIGSIFSQASTAGPPVSGWAAGSMLDRETVALAAALRSDVLMGTPPLHGAELLARHRNLTPLAFTGGLGADPLVGAVPLSTFPSLGLADQSAAIAQETAGWPADVTAHRIGRIIFTHHGIEPGDDPRLWIMIELPTAPGDLIVDAVRLGGTEMFDMATGAQGAIEQQNRIRMKAGMPPLPDPDTPLRTDGPWSAAQGVPPPPTPP